MTAKQEVLKRRPDAKAVKHRLSFWEIISGGVALGTGTTPKSAWCAAANKFSAITGTIYT